mgnify:CR=1 FL=1
MIDRTDEEVLEEIERRFGVGARQIVEATTRDDLEPDDPAVDAAYLSLGWSIDGLTDAASRWAYRFRREHGDERLAIAGALLARKMDEP